MPRAKRSKTETTTATPPEQLPEVSAQAAEQPPVLATAPTLASTAEQSRFRVFAHDNKTGLRYIEDLERRAVVLSFAEKPDEETIAKLRASPFKWDNDAQAWMAHANFSNRHAAQKLFREIVGIKLEGPTPS